MENNTEKQLKKENTLLNKVNVAQIYTIEKLLKENGELKEQVENKNLQLKEAINEIESLFADCITDSDIYQKAKEVDEKDFEKYLYENMWQQYNIIINKWQNISKQLTKHTK